MATFTFTIKDEDGGEATFTIEGTPDDTLNVIISDIEELFDQDAGFIEE